MVMSYFAGATVSASEECGPPVAVSKLSTHQLTNSSKSLAEQLNLKLLSPSLVSG